MGFLGGECMKKSIWIVVAVMVVVSLGFVLSTLFFGKNVIGTIGSQKVTKAEYEFFLHQIEKKMELEANIKDENMRRIFWESKLTGGIDAKEVARTAALDKLKEFKIQYIEAINRKIRLTQDEISEIEKNLGDRVKNLSKDEKDVAMIKEFGVNYAEVLKISKDLKLAVKLAEIEQSEIGVSKDEVLSFYEKYKEDKGWSEFKEVENKVEEELKMEKFQQKVDRLKTEQKYNFNIDFNEIKD